VFLGLHLLVTDPSTSPRTPLGRLFFGILYGLGVFGLYSLLGAMGAPTFYDKLMCVPLLNLSVPVVDRVVAAIVKRPILSSLRLDGPLGKGNLAHMGAWVVFFAFMTATGRTDGRHIGDSLPFWQQACEANRPNACRRLLQVERSYCDDNSGWACNELGAHYAEGRLVSADPSIALGFFSRACELRFQAACVNLLDLREISRAAAGVRPGGSFSARAASTSRHARGRSCARASTAGRTRAAGHRPRTELAPPPTDQSRRAVWIGWAVLAVLVAIVAAVLFQARTQPAAGAAPARYAAPPGSEVKGFRPDTWFLPDDDLLGFVEVPAGPFLMGSDPARDPLAFDNERWPGAKPQATVDLPAFYVGRYEVTVAQFGAFVDETAHRVDAQALRAPASHPVSMVTWPGVLAYCHGWSRR
jgi:hypothetical protein